MLFDHTLFTTALVAFLAVASPAVAELVQGPSGTIQHVKRFQPSTRPDGAVCRLTCPNYTPPQANAPPTVSAAEAEGFVVDGFPGQTACDYHYLYQDGAGNTFAQALNCWYQDDTGLLRYQTPGCAPTAGDPVCTPSDNVAVFRRLSKLEEVIKARQYRPARAGRPAVSR